jgi:hypothetical protein
MKQWKAWVCLLVFCMGIISENLPTVQAADVDTSDEAYLLMIAAGGRLSDEDPILVQNPNTMQMVFMQVPQQKLGINEYKTLSDFYLDFAARLPADHPLVAHFTNKSLTNLEKAQQLDRARRRRNNPFRRFIRAVTWPALKIARGVGWSIRKGVEYLNEVGPEIIKEMLKGYITTGTPFTAKAFWKAVGKRLKTAITNEAQARLAAVLQGNQNNADNDEEQKAATATETASQEKPTKTPSDEERAYGVWQVTVEFLEQDEYWGYWVDNVYIDYPFDRHLVDPYDWASPSGMWYDVTVPMTINLDQGTITASFKGNGEMSEAEFVYERGTANFSGSFSDVWIQPTADGLGWQIGGTASITLHVDDELRCWYNPDDPNVGGYFVWVPNTIDHTFQVPVEGLIYEDMTSSLSTMEIYIGGQGINDPDYSFYLQTTEIPLPEEFPLP